MINAVRWIFVLPASYLGYYLAMIGGMTTHAIAESFCPPEAMISGWCAADYMRPVETILFLVFPGVAAVLVVLMPTLVAPTEKTVVATASFVVGGSVAVYLAASVQEWGILVFALLCGGITAWSVFVYQDTHKGA